MWMVDGNEEVGIPQTAETNSSMKGSNGTYLIVVAIAIVILPAAILVAFHPRKDAGTWWLDRKSVV